MVLTYLLLIKKNLRSLTKIFANLMLRNDETKCHPQWHLSDGQRSFTNTGIVSFSDKCIKNIRNLFQNIHFKSYILRYLIN